LSEIYSVRSRDLPEPKHVSTLEDLRLLLPVDVGAGKRLFVLDLSRAAPMGRKRRTFWRS
jgi:hypothetical protein